MSEDDYDGEPSVEPRAKVGDLYRLGNHYLICGDCTDENVINRLLNGIKANLLLTDPPYGISVVSRGVQSEREIGSVGGGGPLHFRKSRRWKHENA